MHLRAGRKSATTLAFSWFLRLFPCLSEETPLRAGLLPAVLLALLKGGVRGNHGRIAL